MRYLLLALLLTSSAFAQTTRTVILDSSMPSVWSPQTWIQTKSVGVVSLLDTNAAVVMTTPVSQDGFFSSMQAKFPPAASGVSLAYISVQVTQTGVGWSGSWAATRNVPFSLSLAAGEVLTLTYQPSLTGLGATLIADVVSPAPPPPPTTTSKPGDSVPPLTQLVTSDLAIWTIASGKVLRNAVDTKSYSDINKINISTVNTIRATSATRGYECWNGTTWVGSGC